MDQSGSKSNCAHAILIALRKPTFLWQSVGNRQMKTGKISFEIGKLVGRELDFPGEGKEDCDSGC
jgi:hypothetical protein